MGMTLAAKTSTGSGEAIGLDLPTDRFSFQAALTTGSGGSAVVRLQGSVNGVGWTNIGSSAITISSTMATTIFQATATRVVPYVRANVTTHPGNSRKLSVWVAGKGA